MLHALLDNRAQSKQINIYYHTLIYYVLQAAGFNTIVVLGLDEAYSKLGIYFSDNTISPILISVL